MTPPTPTPDNETLANASADITNGFADMSGLAGPMVVLTLYAVGALLAAQVLAPRLANSRVLERVGKRIATTLVYAIKGAAASAILALIALPAYLAVTMDGETRGAALEYLALALVAFVALVGIGWLADLAVTAYIDAHPRYEEWGDLFPETEEDSEALADGGDA